MRIIHRKGAAETNSPHTWCVDDRRVTFNAEVLAASTELSPPIEALETDHRTPSLPRQGVVFATIGVISTLAYLVLFWLLRDALGAQGANLVALLVTAVANTAANRRFTFGVRGRRRVTRHQFEGLVVFGIGLGLTSGSLALLHMIAGPHVAPLIELAVLVFANLLSTLVRFVLLRLWVFHPKRAK